MIKMLRPTYTRQVLTNTRTILFTHWVVYLIGMAVGVALGKAWF